MQVRHLLNPVHVGLLNLNASSEPVRMFQIPVTPSTMFSSMEMSLHWQHLTFSCSSLWICFFMISC